MYLTVEEVKANGIVMHESWVHQVGDFVVFNNVGLFNKSGEGKITSLLAFRILSLSNVARPIYAVEGTYFMDNSNIQINLSTYEKQLDELIDL